MSIVNGYTDLTTVKDRLGIPSTNTKYDTRLDTIIQAVSRWVDAHCGRFFYQANQTRYYTTPNTYPFLVDGRLWAGPYLWIDDLVSVTQIATDFDGDGVFEDVWATSDYYLQPYNAPLAAIPEPYTHIEIAPYGRQAFPAIPRGAMVQGIWGWPEIPDAVSEATVLQTIRLFRRGDAPFGVVGSHEFGQAMPTAMVDPDVRFLLAVFRRLAVG